MRSFKIKLYLRKYFTNLCFVCFFIPAFCFADVPISKQDSLKFAASLVALEQISSTSADSIILYVDHLLNENSSKNSVLQINKVAGATLTKYGYLQLAERYYIDALALSEKLNDVQEEVNLINSLGVLWARQGDYTKAESYFLKALLISEKRKVIEGLVSSYLKLSTLRIRQYRYSEALNYCFKGDSVNKLYRVGYLKSDLVNNKAIVFATEGKLDEALMFFEEGYKLAVQNDKILEQVLALQNIGLVYKEKGSFVRANDYLNKALAITRKNGLKEEELRVAINVPALLVEEKQIEKAKTEYLSLLRNAEKLGVDDVVLEILGNLSEIAENENNYKEAYGYFKKLTRLKTKQTNIQKNKALQEATISLGLYQANLKILESENLLFQKNRERNILFGIVVFVLILLVFLVLILVRLKRLNDRLNKSTQQLTESNLIKNKLFSIIGHDLRGNQGTSLGILSLIKDGDLNEEESRFYLDLIIKQSTSALSTLDDLLLWGQAQIKGNKLTKSNVPIEAMVNKCVDLNLEAINEKTLAVSHIHASNKDVFMDANHFGFILRNLISNAIKFTPVGGRIEVTVSDHDNKSYKICVTDNGVGISKDQLATMFLPSSISLQGTNNEKGTGLGLTLCKEFVEANGGKIWAESTSGEGTTVCFTCEKGKG